MFTHCLWNQADPVDFCNNYEPILITFTEVVLLNSGWNSVDK